MAEAVDGAGAEETGAAAGVAAGVEVAAAAAKKCKPILFFEVIGLVHRTYPIGS